MLRYQSTGEAAIQCNAICEVLRSTMIGETTSYEDISKYIGQDVLKIRHILQRARNELLEKEGMIFDSVHKIGLKKISIHEINAVSDKSLRRIRRTARKANKELAEAIGHANDVSTEERNNINARRSLFGAIEAMATNRVVKKIEPIVDNNVLPMGRVLEMFRSM